MKEKLTFLLHSARLFVPLQTDKTKKHEKKNNFADSGTAGCDGLINCFKKDGMEYR